MSHIKRLIAKFLKKEVTPTEKKEYITPTISRRAIYVPRECGHMGLGKNPGGPLYFNRCRSKWEQK